MQINHVVINDDRVWIDNAELFGVASVLVDAPSDGRPDEPWVTITFIAHVDRVHVDVGPKSKTEEPRPTPTHDVDVQAAIEKARKRLEKRGKTQ